MASIRYSLTVGALAVSVLAAVDIRQPLAAIAHESPALSSEASVVGEQQPEIEQEVSTETSEVLAAAREQAAPLSSCPPDMVEVAGDYCPAPEQICDDYISEKRDRCVRFRPTVRCIGTPSPKHFCIDRYEYPNEAGKQPTVAVSWDEARDLCATEGKRLCAAEEWTLACEGPEMKPYPFGFVRDAAACNIDKPYILPDNSAYESVRTRAEEIARVSQSEASGSRQRCVSDYGVFDMTGNVDEWVVNERGTFEGPEYQSGLKGGYWGPVRNRCRPMTTDHNRRHHGYQIGFRCCKDIGAQPAADAHPGVPVDQVQDEWESPEATQPSRS